ncbi:hypothetical protein QA447_07135 [Pseudomonas sp. abacavir_1]
MTDQKPKFHVIDGTPAPKQDAVRERLKSRPKPASMIQCHRCGCREVIETKIGVMMKNGKPSGGTKQLLCSNCFMRGERVVVS